MPSTVEAFSVRLPDDLKAEVDSIAKASKRSRSFIIKEAVTAYVEEHALYLKAIDEALAEADKGIFVSGEKAFEWMDALAKGDMRPVPEPDIFPDK